MAEHGLNRNNLSRSARALVSGRDNSERDREDFASARCRLACAGRLAAVRSNAGRERNDFVSTGGAIELVSSKGNAERDRNGNAERDRNGFAAARGKLVGAELASGRTSSGRERKDTASAPDHITLETLAEHGLNRNDLSRSARTLVSGRDNSERDGEDFASARCRLACAGRLAALRSNAERERNDFVSTRGAIELVSSKGNAERDRNGFAERDRNGFAAARGKLVGAGELVSRRGSSGRERKDTASAPDHITPETLAEHGLNRNNLSRSARALVAGRDNSERERNDFVSARCASELVSGKGNAERDRNDFAAARGKLVGAGRIFSGRTNAEHDRYFAAARGKLVGAGELVSGRSNAERDRNDFAVARDRLVCGRSNAERDRHDIAVARDELVCAGKLVSGKGNAACERKDLASAPDHITPETLAELWFKRDNLGRSAGTLTSRRERDRNDCASPRSAGTLVSGRGNAERNCNDR